jgi:hypothetical protein
MLSMLSTPLRKRAALGATAVLACGALMAGGIAPAFAADPVTSDLILLVGADESERVVNWYSTTGGPQTVQVAPTKSLVKGRFPAGARTFTATVAANTVSGGYNGHAVLTGLDEKTDYSYRVLAGGEASETHEFSTGKGKGNFDFLFFGDPQIGSSGSVAQDSAGWVDTLNVALAADPNVELLVSGGDQVNTANNEAEWDGFLAPEQLTEVPWVPTIGNHDVGGKAYEQHLWTPNTDRSDSHFAGNPATTSGGDYWFTHNGVLFIDLNSNAYKTSAAGVDADDAHLAYIKSVLAAQDVEPRYTVLVYHHAIYSPADHANDSDNAERRRDFTTAFSDLGVDLVLQGHDHSYSRSYQIRNGVKANPAEQPGQQEVFQGPGGVTYVTANSASGSKYYDLTDPVVGSDYGPDPLNPDNHWANSVENQDHVRTYVKVSVKENQLKVENVVAGDCSAPNAAVERGNVDWCGPDEGASPAQPVGSLVDSVTIHTFLPGQHGAHGGAPGKLK